MNVFYFIIAFAFFLLGIFVGGIASISIALFIPFHVLGHGEQR
jgi:hypothetical protein